MADDANAQSPFTRPGFIAGAVVVTVLLVAGIILVIVNLTRGPDAPIPTPEPTTTTSRSTTTPTADAGGESVCGLEGVELDGTVSTAPAAEWVYAGTVAYPRSPEFGAADTAAEGYPYCFKHSAEGALFMAATSVAVPADTSQVGPWVEYALSEGAFRDTLLSDVAPSDSSGVRLQLVGFRLLSYDGDTARVDLAVRGSSEGTTVTGSIVYELIWEEGDWKINANVAAPFDFATIPDTSGYIPWAA